MEEPDFDVLHTLVGDNSFFFTFVIDKKNADNAIDSFS